MTVDAYAGPRVGAKEHAPLHAHFQEGKGKDRVETRVLMQDYYKNGERVGCKGEPTPGDRR